MTFTGLIFCCALIFGYLYNALAAFPLNKIGPVGLPIGEPPSGSSVISNN
jgi:hypothetical protein